MLKSLRYAGILACLLGVGLAVALATPPAVLAHANLASAEPAPNSVLNEAPARVVVRFTEPIEPGLSEIRVLDAGGGRVDDGESIHDPNDPAGLSVGLAPLSDGTYTVAWRNVSTVDGHLVRGSFLFSVGEPISGAPVETPESGLLQSPAEPVVRWALLLGAIAMVGGPFFVLVMVRPALMGRGSVDPVRRLGAALAERSRRVALLAAALFLAASCAQLLIQAATTHEVGLLAALGSPAASMIAETSWGHLWAWRAGLALAFGVVVAMARRPSLEMLALALGGCVLWTLSLTSHGAATAGIRSAALFVDYLHLLAAAAWVGALLHFAPAIPAILRLPSPQQRRACLSSIVPRLSVVGVLSVGTLILTGIFSAWAQVTVAPALITPYGLALAVKVAIVLPLLLTGAVNLMLIRPRLGRSGASGRWLRRTVAGEAVLAVVVVAAVGVLTSLEPARQVAAREGRGVEESLLFRDTAEGTSITLEIEPGRLGPNRITVLLEDRLGRPIDNATGVSVRLTYLDADLGEEPKPTEPVGGGLYALEEAQLSIAGAWQAELVVRRPDAFDARTAFRFETAAGGSGGSAAISPSPETARLLLGGGLALLGALFTATALPLGGWYSRAGAGVMLPGIAGLAAGAVILVSAGEPETVRNPFPPNPESLEAGRVVYEQMCQTCHGVEGRGDGPGAADLYPPPADLVVHVPLHPEHDLFRFVRDGVPGTAMAPLGDRLSDEEIWHVVNYVKTFEE